jgi:hypothetical protein
VSEHFAPIHFGKVKIQQDKVGARGIGVHSLAPEKSHCLDAVRGHMQMDRQIGIAKGFLGQAYITGTVFDQENLYGRAAFSDCIHDFLPSRSKTSISAESPQGCASQSKCASPGLVSIRRTISLDFPVINSSFAAAILLL